MLETISELPDEVSLEEIADKIEFLAAIQKGIDQLSPLDPPAIAA